MSNLQAKVLQEVQYYYGSQLVTEFQVELYILTDKQSLKKTNQYTDNKLHLRPMVRVSVLKRSV